jgi:uncharacterized protein involved in response to NO
MPKPMPVQQADFRLGYVWVALATALFAGFAIAAHLAFVIGFDFPLGKGFYSFIQTHGHVQLVGWVGLFIIGISLHFIPRLSGVPIAQPQWITAALWLIASSLWLRSIAHSVVPYVTERAAFKPLLGLVALSGLLEWLGVLIYIGLLLKTFSKAKEARRRPALMSVAPFFMMMLAGWLLHATLNFYMTAEMALTRNVVLSQGWNEFAIQAFMGLTLVPVIFAFSVRLFPLYLRLPAPDWPVRMIAWFYLITLSVQLLPTLPFLQNQAPEIMLNLSSAGAIVKGGVLLWFVWKLDLLTRRQLPWTVNRVFQPSPDRRPTRPGLPDYGEFGRFERLVYGAYIWLVVGAFVEIYTGASVLLKFSTPPSSDVVRHVYLVGFISQLILGMAVRMIPGFIGQSRVASAGLADASFWLVNIATVCRVLPLIVSETMLDYLSRLAQSVFALSGILGMAAVSCLMINLWKTASRSKTIQLVHIAHKA